MNKTWKKVTPIPIEFNGNGFLFECRECKQTISYGGGKPYPPFECPNCVRKEMQNGKGSAEHEAYKAAYNAERERRRKDPVNYPWFTYHIFGWHYMDYISEQEKDEEVKTYRLTEYTSENGNKGYKRYGRQPIQIVWAGDRKVDE